MSTEVKSTISQLRESIKTSNQFLEMLASASSFDATQASLTNLSEDEVMATNDHVLIAAHAHFMWAYRSRRADRQAMLNGDVRKFRERSAELFCNDLSNLSKSADALKSAGA